MESSPQPFLGAKTRRQELKRLKKLADAILKITTKSNK